MLVGARLGAEDFHASMAALEQRHGGRLGVAVLDADGSFRLEYRSRERFALCSTFKLLLAAAVLDRVDHGKERLERRVDFGAADLITYSPVVGKHALPGSLSVEALCEAAMVWSDNTAANLLLGTLGGPEGLTGYLRTLGDGETRLDRWEPDLNANLTGDLRDTTTPRAMAGTVRRLLSGDRLSAASRKRLEGWLLACATGAGRLRAGMPEGWRVGDKTGSGLRGATNDMAVVWIPRRPPIFIAAYYSGAVAAMTQREAVLAEVGRIVAMRLLGASSPFASAPGR